MVDSEAVALGSATPPRSSYVTRCRDRMLYALFRFHRRERTRPDGTFGSDAVGTTRFKHTWHGGCFLSVAIMVGEVVADRIIRQPVKLSTHTLCKKAAVAFTPSGPES